MKDIPVCVYPYDDNTSKIAAEIAKRPNVQLYSNLASIQHWDRFSRKVWDTHPTARRYWKNNDLNFYYRVGTHRRFCAFDAPFDRFLYLDADTILLNSVDFIFNQLDQQDWVVYDFQFKDLSHVYTRTSHLAQVFSDAQLTNIFCSGLYASRQGIFSAEQQNELILQLETGDAEILYPMAPDQTILNYMVMKSNLSTYNFGLELPPEQRTGCCVTSPGFKVQDNLLYDRGNQLTYLHYIGLSSSLFNRVCQGENIDFPYRDLFLHYRYLSEPENRPMFTGQSMSYDAPARMPERILKKLKLTR